MSSTLYFYCSTYPYASADRFFVGSNDASLSIQYDFGSFASPSNGAPSQFVDVFPQQEVGTFRPTASFSNSTHCVSTYCGTALAISCQPIVPLQHVAVTTTTALTAPTTMPIVIYNGGVLSVFQTSINQPIYVLNGGKLNLMYQATALLVYLEDGGKVFTRSGIALRI
jgi:hypothetical protein